MSNSSISCNRTPFISDEECDRGSVDIHQFDDFPFCEPINPTPPGIPPEVVETPLLLPVPPACSCIHISYNMGLKYNQSRKFSADANFKAIGDCCEGKYKSEFNLEIPCPIMGNKGSRTITTSITYGKGKQTATASFLSIDKKNCTIEGMDANLNLEIPCPVIGNNSEKKIKASIVYGRGRNSASAKFLKPNPEACTIEGLDVNLNLEIPCPVKKSGEKKISIGLDYGSGNKRASTAFLRANSSNCTIEGIDANIRLEIPCPVKSATGKRIKIGISYGSGHKSASASFIKTNRDKCEIEPLSPNIHLNIPCPVKKTETKRIKAKITYGSGPQSASENFIRTDPEKCEIEPLAPNLNLQIPCPVKGSGAKRIKVKIQRGVGGEWYSASGSFIRIDSSGCGFEVLEPELKLQIPGGGGGGGGGPVFTKGKKKIQIKKVAWTCPSNLKDESHSFYSGTDGSMSFKDIAFNLKVPCPLTSSNLKVSKGEITQGNTESSYSFNIDDDGGECNNECERELKFNIKFPKGSKKGVELKGNDTNASFVFGEKFAFEAANDANVKVNVANGTIKIGVYYR